MASNMPVVRHSSILIFFHWLTSFAILFAFALVWSKEIFDLESVERNIIFIHKSVGVLVILLTLIRILIKITGNAGESVLEPNPMLARLARLVHVGLYALMIVVPVIGWLKSNAAGKSVSMFGIILPALVEENRDLAKLFGEFHEFFAYVLLVSIALHVAAALWHKIVRKDGVMYSILPIKRLSP